VKVWFAFAVLLAALATASPARANLPVFEVYVGQRPKKVELAVSVFEAELERTSPGLFASPKRLTAAFASRLPQPGSDPAITAAEVTRRLQLADATWIRHPALAELLPVLASAVELGKANPALLVADAGRRDVFRRVLLAYALALQRNGGGQPSQDAMAEWIRTFPDQVVTRARAGVDGEQLYQDTRRVLSARGRGTLTVNLSDASLQLYVDETIRRPGAQITDLVPGSYRVLVVDRFGHARRYAIDVLANQDSMLAVDWQVDSMLRVTPAFIGFELESATDLAQAGQPIARFAQAAIGAPGALLIKQSKTERGGLVTADVYAADHVSPVTSASIAITGNARTDSERALALARFVLSHAPQPDVIVNAVPAEAVTAPGKVAPTALDAKTMAPTPAPPH
jgi:hypothetical protein